MIKCSIVGFGKMGQIRASAIEESGAGKVIGVYDTDNSVGRGYRQYSTDIEAVQDPEADAVFVCTPNYRIAPLCQLALESGKHVFSEKPPAFCSADLHPVLEQENVSGKVLMYGFNHRHHGSIQKMKEVIDTGEMGRVLWMRGRYGKEVSEDYFSGWRANKELSGGGIMLDQGIHMLDLFVYLAGKFDEVQAMVSNLFWELDGVEDNVFVQLRSNETGVCASLHSTMTQWRYLFSLEVFLERGAMILNGLKTSSGAYGDEELAIKHNVEHRELGQFQGEQRLLYHHDSSWVSEVSMFFEAINKGERVPIGNSSDALTVMRLMDEIYAHK